MQKKLLFAVILLLLLPILISCSSTSPPLRPDEVQIPFESMVEEEWGANDFVKEPELILVRNDAEVSQLEPLILPAHLQLVQQVDFSKYAVLVLLRGVQATNKRPVFIERISKLNHTLTVRAQFLVPSEEETKAAALTSPYHIVKIEQKYFPSVAMQVELQSYVVQK